MEGDRTAGQRGSHKGKSVVAGPSAVLLPTLEDSFECIGCRSNCICTISNSAGACCSKSLLCQQKYRQILEAGGNFA